MFSIELLLSILVIILALVWYWCKYNYSYWKRNGIPYVEPWPLIGNTKVAFTLENSFGLHLSDLYNYPDMKNEAVIGIYSMHKPALIIRDLELLKSVLIKDFNKFSNRYVSADPHNDALAYYNLFFVNNPEWKEIRNKLTPVFTSGKIKQMYPLMLEITDELEKHLSTYQKTDNSFEVEIKDVCANFTTDLIATIAFGIRVNSLKNPKVEFREHGRKFFQFNMFRAFSFFTAFFLPKFVSIFRVTLFPKDFSDYLRRIFTTVMIEREKTGNKRNDLIDILVNLKQTYSKNIDFLLAQATGFLTAGFETSSSTMAFALYELAQKPELQKRLRNEIHEALVECNGQLTYEKLNSLEYLGMVVDEVLRMYPTLPFLDRVYENPKGEEKLTLEPYYNYTLEDGLPVFIPIFALQRDPKYWENPNEFNPERFSPENRKLITPMTYMPFGNGPHNCIGSRIGLLQAKLGLVHIFKNHFVEPCAKTVKEIKLDPKAFILQCNGGIYLRVVNDQMCNKQIIS